MSACDTEGCHALLAKHLSVVQCKAGWPTFPPHSPYCSPVSQSSIHCFRFNSVQWSHSRCAVCCLHSFFNSKMPCLNQKINRAPSSFFNHACPLEVSSLKDGDVCFWFPPCQQQLPIPLLPSRTPTRHTVPLFDLASPMERRVGDGSDGSRVWNKDGLNVKPEVGKDMNQFVWLSRQKEMCWLKEFNNINGILLL